MRKHFYKLIDCKDFFLNHIKKLQTKLDEVSDEKTRKWFENYLKNVISCRGVKTPTVTKIVSQWRVDEAINKLPLKKQMEIACDLIREKKAEDKLAGIIKRNIASLVKEDERFIQTAIG